LADYHHRRVVLEGRLVDLPNQIVLVSSKDLRIPTQSNVPLPRYIKYVEGSQGSSLCTLPSQSIISKVVYVRKVVAVT
jgi:hypothetical protein